MHVPQKASQKATTEALGGWNDTAGKSKSTAPAEVTYAKQSIKEIWGNIKPWQALVVAGMFLGFIFSLLSFVAGDNEGVMGMVRFGTAAVCVLTLGVTGVLAKKAFAQLKDKAKISTEVTDQKTIRFVKLMVATYALGSGVLCTGLVLGAYWLYLNLFLIMFVYSIFTLFTATMVVFIVGLRGKKKDWGKLKGLVRIGFVKGLALGGGAAAADGRPSSGSSKTAWADDEDDVSRSSTPVSKVKPELKPVNAFMSMKTNVTESGAAKKPATDAATMNSMLNKYAAY